MPQHGLPRSRTILCPNPVFLYRSVGKRTINPEKPQRVEPVMGNRLGQPGWGQLFREKAGPGVSLQWQIREMFASAILDGRIPKGAPLPSCRELARDLGVARYTVVLAYEQLADEGFLFARERSGYFVRDEILGGRVPCAEAQTKTGAG